MSNRIAFFIALVIALAIAIDIKGFDGQYSLFTARKMAELIEYIAFWR